MTDPSGGLADRIAELVDERGWSGSELARRAGLSQSTVSRKLRGVRAWTVPELVAVAEALGVSPAKLLRRSRSG